MSVAGHALPLFALRLHEISPLIGYRPFGQMVIYGKNWDPGKESLVAKERVISQWSRALPEQKLIATTPFIKRKSPIRIGRAPTLLGEVGFGKGRGR